MRLTTIFIARYGTFHRRFRGRRSSDETRVYYNDITIHYCTRKTSFTHTHIYRYMTPLYNDVWGTCSGIVRVYAKQMGRRRRRKKRPPPAVWFAQLLPHKRFATISFPKRAVLALRVAPNRGVGTYTAVAVQTKTDRPFPGRPCLVSPGGGTPFRGRTLYSPVAPGGVRRAPRSVSMGPVPAIDRQTTLNRLNR